MRLSDFPPFKVIAEALDVITSKEKLERVTTTPLYSNAFYLMLNTGVMALFGLFFWIVVVRFYTEAEVGLGSAIISAMSLLSIISLVGLNVSLVRFLPHSDKLLLYLGWSHQFGGSGHFSCRPGLLVSRSSLC